MIRKFEILELFDRHNRGQFIVARHLDFKEPFKVQEGALLNGIPVYHYMEMYPISNEQGEYQFDIYVFRPPLERYPEGYFKVGEVVELVTTDNHSDMTPRPSKKEIQAAVQKLIQMARDLAHNNISDNYTFILTEIKDSEDNFHQQRIMNKKANDQKKPLTLTELMPIIQQLFTSFYDINLQIYEATKNMTVIDFRYYPKSSLEQDYREKILPNPPMLHCKVPIPPWLKDKNKKFDINWEHYKGLNGLKLLWLKIKLKMQAI